MNISKFSLDGKVALVTGGSRGIGRAIALALADVGADVVISSRKLPDLENVAEEIKAAGRKCLPVASHIAKIEDSRNLVERAKAEFDRIDILVNIAGTNPALTPMLEIKERLWDTIMNVNLKGLFFLSQMVARVMKEHGGGNIINMASVEGLSPYKMTGTYAVSKAGVIMLTKVLAAEWAEYNIRVNAIAPGWVQTNFSQAIWDNHKYWDSILARTPLGRIAQSEEMTGAVIYLASEASSYVTGETIVIDGGLTI